MHLPPVHVEIDVTAQTAATLTPLALRLLKMRKILSANQITFFPQRSLLPVPTRNLQNLGALHLATSVSSLIRILGRVLEDISLF